MEKPVIKEIEDAAEHYVTIRDKRMALTEKECEAQAELLAAMKAHKLDSYRYDERIVSVVKKDKARVKSVEEEIEVE